jgi:hypothetical protein
MPVAIELSPEEQQHYRKTHWRGAAVKGGLLAGAIVWLFPSGNPWTSFARPSLAHVMGRSISDNAEAAFFTPTVFLATAGHFAVSILLALVIALVVIRLRSWKAILTGALCGLAFYGVNFLLYSQFLPRWRGEYELNVALAHLLFGALAAGAIRGFLRPPQKLDMTQPNPGARLTDPEQAEKTRTRPA